MYNCGGVISYWPESFTSGQVSSTFFCYVNRPIGEISLSEESNLYL